MEVRANALGVLDGISWKGFEDKRVEFRIGCALIPGELNLRFLTEEEKEKINSHPFFRSKPLWKNADRYFGLESKNTDVRSLGDDNHPIRKALFAFQLLKPGSIFLEGIYLFNPETGEVQGKQWTPPYPDFYLSYEFFLDDVTKVAKILMKLQSVDFEKKLSLRIACDRFNKVYRDIQPEDKLIDLMIAFEALFLTPSRRGGKGPRIGKNCSELIKETNTEKKKIRTNIERAYLIRNDVLHSSPFDRTEILILLPSLEEYLRKSILCLIP